MRTPWWTSKRSFKPRRMETVSSTVGGVDHHRLEAALERGVLLDVLAVLVERGGADAVELAAREHRLEQVAGVGRAFGLAGADDVVDLVDEQDDAALALLDLVEHRLQALLELAAVLGAGEQRAHVEREDAALLEPLGDVAAHDALGQALDDRGLADARLADQHRVVLGLARQDAHHAADLGVAADHRIELVGPRLRHQVDAVLLERLVGDLGVGAGHALAAAHLLQRRRGSGCARCANRRSAWPTVEEAGRSSSARKRCSTETYSSLSRFASSSARVSTCWSSGVT